VVQGLFLFSNYYYFIKKYSFFLFFSSFSLTPLFSIHLISCQYLHGNPGDICRDFTRRGRCYRGDNCPFTHQVPADAKPEVCMKFLKGECTRGQNCLYLHSRDRSQEVCRKYLRNECTRGANCNYSHPPFNAATEEGKREYSSTDFN
jgi:hypothetical protein